MPQVVAQVWVPVPPGLAFAVSQTTGEVRLSWDPFIRHQHLVGADRPAKNVCTVTRARVGPFGGFRMVSRYVSYAPPTSVGVTTGRGPWFFARFGGGWRFTPETRAGVAGTTATWKDTCAVRPRVLRRVAGRSGSAWSGARSGPASRPSPGPAPTPGCSGPRSRQVASFAQGCCASPPTSRRNFCPATDNNQPRRFQGHNDR